MLSTCKALSVPKGSDSGGEEDRGDLGNVVAEDVDDEFAYVGVDGATEFDRGDDGCEGVIQEHHDRCFAGHVGPGDAHGHADVGLLERGGIVDAVSGRGDDLAEVLEGSDDALFVLGRTRANTISGWRRGSSASWVTLIASSCWPLTTPGWAR